MFRIVIHCKPQKDNEVFYGNIIGAYASMLIEFADFSEGEIKLSRSALFATRKGADKRKSGSDSILGFGKADNNGRLIVVPFKIKTNANKE